jgi:hypothetical protein
MLALETQQKTETESECKEQPEPSIFLQDTSLSSPHTELQSTEHSADTRIKLPSLN